jgi:beta-aspartyl-dipeptidase (metallo-type)
VCIPFVEKLGMYLIKNAELFTPEPCVASDVLILNEKISAVGDLNAAELQSALPDLIVIDAKDSIVIPGLIDPHEHLTGAGGEEGFDSRTYCVPITQILHAGITTVVGCLGTDTTTHSLINLLARVRQLEGMGCSAYMMTGGFQLPTPTITRIVLDDIVIIDKVIGVGEISIADERAVEPDLHELTKIIIDASVAGQMAGKGGFTHFHTGSRPNKFATLHKILDEYPHLARYIYPTHVQRTQELFDDAIKLCKRGCYIDLDCTEEDLVKWLSQIFDKEVPLDRITVSSDAHTPSGSGEKYFGQFQLAARECGMKNILPFFTHNVACVLGVDKTKGKIEKGFDADITILDKSSLDVKHVFSMGRHVLNEGEVVVEIKDKTTGG